MYKKILVALENGPPDMELLSHVSELAYHLGSELLLLNVAEGFVARHFDDLQLDESEEMVDNRAYLESQAEKARRRGITVETALAAGDPVKEILNFAETNRCDLIAMGSHGHRLLGDIFFGSAIRGVRHASSIPVLIVTSKRE